MSRPSASADSRRALYHMVISKSTVLEDAGFGALMVTLVGYVANWKMRGLRTLVVYPYTFHPLRPPLPEVDGTLLGTVDLSIV